MSGRLAIGGAIGAVAVMIKQEFLLVIIGGVFVIEALSVILQVASFKLFRPAHLQDDANTSSFRVDVSAGSSRRMEPKMVFRFLIMAILFALVESFDVEVEIRT